MSSRPLPSSKPYICVMQDIRLILVVALSTVCHAETSKPLILATGGVAQAVIVVAADAPHPVHFAATELAEHLESITGAGFSIVDEAPVTGAAIVLGDGVAARQAGVDVEGIARDGYTMRTIGERIYIAGRDDMTDKSLVLFDVKTPLSRDLSRYEMEPWNHRTRPGTVASRRPSSTSMIAG